MELKRGDMKNALLLAAILCLEAPFAFSESWKGALVDADCYAREERNVNPFDPPFYANHDRGFSIRACRPSAKTKSFTVVDSDGQTLALDAAGNAKAADLVRRSATKSRMLTVTITGEKTEKTVRVDSISLSGEFEGR
jgi:ribosomal protein S17